MHPADAHAADVDSRPGWCHPTPDAKNILHEIGVNHYVNMLT